MTPDQTVSGWLTEKRKSADFGNPPEPQLVDCLTNDAWLDGYECGQRSRPTDAEIQAWGQEIRQAAYERGWHDGWTNRIHAHQQAAHDLTTVHKIWLDRDHSGYIPRRPDGVGALSQNEIAERAGVSQQRVSQILAEPQLTSASELPSHRQGADGKVRPASRPAVVTAKDETDAARAQQRRVTA